ncbi:cytoplasmic FMR1-interacting, partial [Blyttiomyces helicus]
MIKNLSGLLSGLDRKILEAIDRHVYVETQTFAKSNVAEFYVHAVKKKRPAAAIVKHVRDFMLDGPFEEEVSKGAKKEKDAKSPTSPDVPKSRVDPISLSQIHFARAFLDSVFNEKAKGMKGGLMKEKDFKDSLVAEMQAFYAKSYFYPYMLDLKATVSRCSDLSDLWFKEFYLELTKQVQFPINMSLPWILTEYILESNDAEMIEYLFYPFDIYNDAANRTLYTLKSKFIYDEIVAEVNLCFDQLIFKISHSIFLHFKKAASWINLSPDLKVEVDELLNHPSRTAKEMPFDSYDRILSQKGFQLLGRSLNISELLSQMMNQYLRKSIDMAIARYEGSDITYIIHSRTTHALLSRFCTLDRFDDMVAEMDESVSPLAANGRILTHSMAEIVNDFVPNFCYNS